MCLLYDLNNCHLEGTNYAHLIQDFTRLYTFLCEPNIEINEKQKLPYLQNLTDKSYKQSDNVYTLNTYVYMYMYVTA